MKVILIRHGETSTSGKSYAGRSDVSLTPHGHEQARRIAEGLAVEPLTDMLVSPLSRAIDTAAPLGRQHALDPQVTPALSEIDFGVLEGQDKGVLGVNLRKSHAHLPIPGGESLADVWKRAGDVINLIPASPGTLCAVVGHFWINRLLWGRLRGLSFEAACASRDFRPATGSWAAIDSPPVAAPDNRRRV